MSALPNFDKERFRKLRIACRMTYGELADELRDKGLRTTAIKVSRWERGTERMTPAAARVIAEFFEIDYTALFRP